MTNLSLIQRAYRSKYENDMAPPSRRPKKTVARELQSFAQKSRKFGPSQLKNVNFFWKQHLKVKVSGHPRRKTKV